MLYCVGWVIFYLVIRAVVGLLAGWRVEGRENLPRKGAVIIAPNHVSFSDPPIVEAAIRRGSWFMASDELFAMKLLGPLARMMRGYPVKQDSPDRSALRKTEDLLKRGQSVVVFPEGHVSKNGKLQPIQPGIILVALRTGAPILPVGLLNTDKLMPPHTFKLRRSPAPVVIRIGNPMTAQELAGGKKGRAAVDHGVMLLKNALLELTGQDEETIPESAVGGTDPAAKRSQPPIDLHGPSVAEYSRG